MIGNYPRKAKFTKKTNDLLERDARLISPSYTRDYPFFVQTGRGREVIDVEGNAFLDFGAGIAVCATGHCHPKVVSAIKAQTDEFLHMSGTDFFYRQQTDLAEKLGEIAGMKEGMVFYGNSGAEAVEAAMKLARFYKNKPGFIAFTGAFHGRTMGAVSLTASKAVQREYYAPLQPVAHTPYGDCNNCQFNHHRDHCAANGSVCIDYIEHTILGKVMPVGDCAAIVMEPIQGEGGYIVPEAFWMEDLQRLANKYDLLLICDEVQAGMGRTGKWFAHQNYDGFKPDIITFAKGIASGMPLGGIITERDLMRYWVPGSHASTFGGNPVSCAAALATINVIEEEDLLENANAKGKLLRTLLEENSRSIAVLENTRGLGLMSAVDIVGYKDGVPIRDTVLNKCFDKGLILLGCGKEGVRFCPALNITTEEICKCTEILFDTIKEVIK